MSINTTIPATDSQLAAVDRILRRMLAEGDDLEIKDLRIQGAGKRLSVIVETGHKADEGTTRSQVFVGRRGGLTAVLCGRVVRVKLWEVPHLEARERQMRRVA